MPDIKSILYEYRQYGRPLLHNWKLSAFGLEESVLERLGKSRAYFEKKSGCLFRQLAVVRKLAAGIPDDDSYPWWVNNDSAPSFAKGLARSRPVKDEETGKLSYMMEGKTAPFVELNDAKEGTQEKIAITEKPISLENIEDKILAIEEIGILGWESFELSGNEAFVRKGIKVAVENGLWPYLHVRHREKIEEEIKAKAPFGYIFSRLLGKHDDIALSGNIYEIENALDESLEELLGHLRDRIEELKAAGLNRKNTNGIEDAQTWIMELEKFRKLEKGSLIAKIISSESQGPFAFQNILTNVMWHIEQFPDVAVKARECIRHCLVKRELATEDGREKSFFDLPVPSLSSLAKMLKVAPTAKEIFTVIQGLPKEDAPGPVAALFEGCGKSENVIKAAAKFTDYGELQKFLEGQALSEKTKEQDAQAEIEKACPVFTFDDPLQFGMGDVANIVEVCETPDGKVATVSSRDDDFPKVFITEEKAIGNTPGMSKSAVLKILKEEFPETSFIPKDEVPVPVSRPEQKTSENVTTGTSLTASL